MGAKLKLLLSLEQCSSPSQFIGFSRNSRSLVDISGIFILVGFSRIFGLVKSSRFLRYRVGISRNLRLVDLGRFSRF